MAPTTPLQFTMCKCVFHLAAFFLEALLHLVLRYVSRSAGSHSRGYAARSLGPRQLRALAAKCRHAHLASTLVPPRVALCALRADVPPFAGDGAGSATQALASGDADGTIIVWKRMPQLGVPWEAAACLKVRLCCLLFTSVCKAVAGP